MKFDPYGWAENYLSPKQINLIIKIVMVSLFLAFFLKRLLEYKNFYLKSLWLVETFIFLVLAGAFFLRHEAIDRSKGLKEIIIPLIGGLFPFLLLLTKPHPWIYKDTFKLEIVFWAMTAATCLTIWGMWTLRSSFSITVEVRKFISNGPYKLIRHPIYFGEILTATVVAIWRFSWVNILILACFIIVQLIRSRWEEIKLSRYYPAYEEFAKKRFWFLKHPEKSKV